MIIPLTPRHRPRQQVTQKKIPVRNISIIIIIRIGTVRRQQPIATQFLRFGIILVFVIIIIISSVYVYVYRCKIGNKNSFHFTSLHSLRFPIMYVVVDTDKKDHEPKII